MHDSFSNANSEVKSEAKESGSDEETSDFGDDSTTSSSTNASSMSGSKFKLDSENYSAWSVRIEALLRRKDLWIDLNTATANIDKEKAEKAYWRIIDHLDDDNLKVLDTEAGNNSVKALNILKDRDEGKGALSKIQLLNACLTMKCKGELEPHIDEMRQKYAKLKKKGFAVPEMLQVSNLMVSLDASFGSVFTNFLQMDEDKLMFNDVADALLAEQRRRAISGVEDNNACAANRSGNDAKPKRKRPKCVFCNRFGHTKAECRTLQREQNGPSGFRERNFNSDNSRRPRNANLTLGDTDCVMQETQCTPIKCIYVNNSFDLRTAMNARKFRNQGKAYQHHPLAASKFRLIDGDSSPDKQNKLKSVISTPGSSAHAREHEIDCVSPAISILSQSAEENLSGK